MPMLTKRPRPVMGNTGRLPGSAHDYSNPRRLASVGRASTVMNPRCEMSANRRLHVLPLGRSRSTAQRERSTLTCPTAFPKRLLTLSDRPLSFRRSKQSSPELHFICIFGADESASPRTGAFRSIVVRLLSRPSNTNVSGTASPTWICPFRSSSITW